MSKRHIALQLRNLQWLGQVMTSIDQPSRYGTGRRRFLRAMTALFTEGAAMPFALANEAKFLNSMAELWPIYDRSLGMDDASRSSLLMQEYFSPAASLFKRAGFTRAQAIDLGKVARWLRHFDAEAMNIRSVHMSFAHSYRRNLAAFQAAIPDLSMATSPVIVVPSLFSFDAHLQPDGNQLPLFFAPDGIVRYHGPNPDLGVLFSHELFHCYQGQVNPTLSLLESPPIYAVVWSEGGATYASEVMNPSANLLHVLMDDEILLRDCPKVLGKVAQALLANLDSTDEAVANTFFATDANEAWPARCGYYVGLLCARQICKTRSLKELARLAPIEVRELLVGVLMELAKH
jgi:hypothetical protein